MRLKIREVIAENLRQGFFVSMLPAVSLQCPSCGSASAEIRTRDWNADGAVDRIGRDGQCAR